MFQRDCRVQADAVVFIDLPGFNMRVAKRLRNKIKTNDDDLQLNTKLFQLVCPQIWAWKSGRIKDLKRITIVYSQYYHLKIAFLKVEG